MFQNSEKTNDAKKGKSKRPKRGGESKSKGFMHSKDNLRRSQIQMPTAKEQYLVADGHCFLLRNLRKVRHLSNMISFLAQFVIYFFSPVFRCERLVQN